MSLSIFSVLTLKTQVEKGILLHLNILLEKLLQMFIFLHIFKEFHVNISYSWDLQSLASVTH